MTDCILQRNICTVWCGSFILHTLISNCTLNKKDRYFDVRTYEGLEGIILGARFDLWLLPFVLVPLSPLSKSLFEGGESQSGERLIFSESEIQPVSPPSLLADHSACVLKNNPGFHHKRGGSDTLPANQQQVAPCGMTQPTFTCNYEALETLQIKLK